MKKLVIIGGGISGLVCAHAFSRTPGFQITIVEPSSLGGEFLAGGLRYIHKTDQMVDLFESLDIAYSKYPIKGGIMISGKVQKHPQYMKEIPAERANRIQLDHYKKTRRSDPGYMTPRSMNEPGASKPRTALRTDFADFINRLQAVLIDRGVKFVQGSLKSVTKTKAWLDKGCTAPTGGVINSIPYDCMVLTIPLWLIREIADWGIPECMAMKLNIAHVSLTARAYSAWDYVYTPYTPADLIHRFSPDEGGYSAEMNGEFAMADLLSDLNFIFGGTFAIDSVRQGLKGHLLPLPEDTVIEWPDNVAPIGRFAKWDSRSTVDVAYADSIALSERWK